jgi:hypothetical protein
MLDAFNRKGVRKILAAHNSEEHTNDKNEDAITSMVFTPLRFMTPQDAFKSLELAFCKKNPWIRTGTVSSFSINLWPRRYRTQAGSRCEPDFVAEIGFENEYPLIIIGEMKWDAGTAQLEEQMKKQRMAVRTEFEKTFLAADFYSLALVKDKKGLQDIGKDAVVVTWASLLEHLRHFSGEHEDSRARWQMWAKEIVEFLGRAELSIFEGMTGEYPFVHVEENFFYDGGRPA